MLIFYIDECGDHALLTDPHDPTGTTLKSGVSPYFVLAAVGIRDSSRKPLAEALFEIKAHHLGPVVGTSAWAESEIKGRYLARVTHSVSKGHRLMNPEAYRALRTQPQVDAFVRDLGMLFAKYRPLIFTIVVDKQDLLRVRQLGRSMEEPLGAAYTYLQQRVALTMERLHAGEGALLVADQQTQHETFFRSGNLNKVRDRMTEPLPMKPNFKLVLDKPLWVDTELSTWDREIIQLADIAAYAATECMLRGTAPVEPCYLWSVIRPNLAAQWTTGHAQAGGFAIYPSRAPYPRI